MATPDKQSEAQKRSVLDELESYWEEQDALSSNSD